MAKWGRKSWWHRIGDALSGHGSGGSFRRVKTVSWGSGRGKSGASKSSSASGSGIKWGTRPAAAKPAASWGSSRRSPMFSFGGRSKRVSQPAVWGTKPREPRSRPRMRKRTLLLWMLVFMMLFTIPSFIFIERNLRPPLMNIAKIRVKQVATQAINKAITDQVARKSEADKLIDWKMNANGKISGFMLNYAEHISITSETVQTVQAALSEIKDIPEHIPIGHAVGSAIISSFGPTVPVKFEPVGAAKVELSTRERNAGINMVLIEVYIKVVAEVSIIIPFDSEPELVDTEIPISYLLVVGDVPMYYYDSTGKPVGESAQQAPNISVPLEQGSGGGVTTNPNDAGTEEEPSADSLPSDHTSDNGETQVDSLLQMEAE
ncbi:sporulation protein YunB [Paenibacillus sp. LHD-117]|uniref:sporulation protein YunB n=1 Tax=Paenibacillus sp. LHD-117 TaxID=3071412 RepID=UPI0027E0CC0A|nr:sporulation protein YunB [Paenibacillus sp. LHD-117]MDQ6420305.1 sporulation protein YunB [Paenibacillus sp. LHD-117]